MACLILTVVAADSFDLDGILASTCSITVVVVVAMARSSFSLNEQ